MNAFAGEGKSVENSLSAPISGLRVRCYMRGNETDATHMCRSQQKIQLWSKNYAKDFPPRVLSTGTANTLLGKPSTCTCCTRLFGCCYSLKWFPRVLFGYTVADSPVDRREQNVTKVNISTCNECLLLFFSHWYRLWTFVRTISYLRAARSNSWKISLKSSFCLKSLKTRLNVFLNVFREGDWRGRLSSGIRWKGVLYRFDSTLAGSVFAFVCLSWIVRVENEKKFGWENKITDGGGWQKHKTYLLGNKRKQNAGRKNSVDMKLIAILLHY